MIDRGAQSNEGAQVCPFVAFEHERDERATSPDHRHRCFAEPRPAPRAIAHQEAYCLSSAFPVCPTFQDWARREAASPRGAGIGAATAAVAAGAAVQPSRNAPVRGGPGNWPQPPSFAARDSGPTPSGADADYDRDGDEVEEDADDRGAPVFPAARAAPGSGLAGSSADRVAMAGGVAGAGAADARSGWPAADDLSAPRPSNGNAPFSARGESAGVAAGGFPGAGGASARDEDFEPGFDDRAREQGDYPNRDERIGRDEGERRGIFGRRDKRPRVGETRKVQVDEPPAWERPRRNDAYPTTRKRMGMPGLSKIVLFAVLLVAAAVAVFFLPQLLINRASNPSAGVASPTAPAAASASAAASELPTAAPTPTPFTYTVKPKDTLTKIAARFGVTVDQILAANPTITNPNVVSIGDKLVIPTAAPSAAP
jgi:LysM domain-containing protein